MLPGAAGGRDRAEKEICVKAKSNDRARLAEAALLQEYRRENKTHCDILKRIKIWSIKRGSQRYASNMIRLRMT